MQFSIVPEIISERKIRFFDEQELPLDLCEKSFSSYIDVFEKPFLIIDTFAKKTVKKEEIVSVDIDELKNLDYAISVRNVHGRGWYKGQKVIYYLEKRNIRIPGSRRINYIPQNHKLQKDIPNKRVRIVGTNAGINGFGAWNDIKC